MLAIAGCGGSSSSSNTPATTTPTPTPTGGSPQGVAETPPAVQLEDVLGGFSRPIGMASTADGRIFIVEQPGVIQIVKGSARNPQPFLDIQNKVVAGGETGLLGLAFHPQFAQNGRFYVYYVRSSGSQLQSVFSEFTVAASNPDVADPASEKIVLTVDQPFPNHKGGQINFGPDGFLYIALGDGGSEGDPLHNGQNTNTLLGKILRINVDTSPYSIPPDNPFVNGGGKPEIFAYGFRNPWRFSFDMPSQRLFAGDVGENTREEIDIVTRGGNYGWSVMEGTFCFRPATGCDKSGKTLPIFDYGRTDGGTVIGGYVYHGSALPQLQGFYVYGDFLSGRIWALREGNGTWTRFDLASPGRKFTSFGQDAQGELYVMDLAGTLSKIVAK